MTRFAYREMTWRLRFQTIHLKARDLADIIEEAEGRSLRWHVVMGLLLQMDSGAEAFAKPKKEVEE